MTTPHHAPFDVGSRAIRGVRPLRLDPTLERGTWSCTRCGRDHPVVTSSAVEFDSNGRRLRFVVCPECAELYRVPRPVKLDLRKLPPADRAEGDLRTVTALAWFVSNARQPPPAEVVHLRDADVRELAQRNRETPRSLIRRLADRDLLASA